MYLTKRATCNIFFLPTARILGYNITYSSLQNEKSRQREEIERERPSLWICSKRSAEKKRSTCSHNGSIVLCIMCLNISGCV